MKWLRYVLDPRIVRIGIEVNGKMQYYSDLNIQVSGTKYGNANENECEVKITNLSKQVRDYILTQTSPFLKPHYDKTPPAAVTSAKKTDTSTKKKDTEPKSDGSAEVLSGMRLVVEAGRESTGASVVFIGDITSAVPSQPPDIELNIKAVTLSRTKGEIVSVSKGAATSLKSIAGDIAKDLGLGLLFQAKDKKIGNFAFTGGKLKQVDELGRAGSVNAFVDDEQLIVKDTDNSLTGKSRVLNLETGMIGIPELTEHGIKVKYLYDNQSVVGGALVIESKLNPAANGTYIIFKLSFDIANRENQFYLMAEAKRT